MVIIETQRKETAESVGGVFDQAFARFQRKVPAGAGPLEIATHGAQLQLNFVQSILGKKHAYSRFHEKNSVGKVGKSVDVNTALLDDTYTRWGSATFSETPIEDATQRIATYDYFRSDFWGNIYCVLAVLENNGEFGASDTGESGSYLIPYGENGNKARVPYDLVDEFAPYQPGGERRIEVLDDPRVPWIYILGQTDRKEMEKWTQIGGIDLLHRIYQGEFGLPQDLLDEMNNLGTVFLSTKAENFSAMPIDEEIGKGRMVVAVSDQWTKEDGRITPFGVFLNGVVPSFGHEMRHVADYRTIKDSPASVAIMETRGLLTELDILTTNGSHQAFIDRRRMLLASYQSVICGTGDGNTHDEEGSRKDVIDMFSGLLPKDQTRVLTALQRL